jgi:hypothetical protein
MGRTLMGEPQEKLDPYGFFVQELSEVTRLEIFSPRKD